MEHTKMGRKTPVPLGICYFVDRRQVGPEVRFPRRPVTEPVTKPETEKHAFPLGKPVTEMQALPPKEYLGFAYYEAIRQRRRRIAKWILLSPFLCCCLFTNHILFWIGPKPSPAIIPAPPYHERQVIKGPDTTGQIHTWVYVSTVGWVDP